MKFIREMIARKAAGDEQSDRDFGFEGLDSLTSDDQSKADQENPSVLGFEDELGDETPVVDTDETAEDHANVDEPRLVVASENENPEPAQASAEQLMDEPTEHTTSMNSTSGRNRKKKSPFQSRALQAFGIDDDTTSNTLADGPTALSKKPIADLFSEATIMFADIAGFTAWSSAREPGQVSYT